MMAMTRHKRGYVTQRRSRAVDLRLAVACVIFRGCPMSYRAIGDAIGISNVAVLKIARRAMKKVRASLREREFA